MAKNEARNRRVTCKTCGLNISFQSKADHMRRAHPDVTGDPEALWDDPDKPVHGGGRPPKATVAPASNRRVICLLCEHTVTLNNFTTHLRNRHPDRVGTPRKQLIAEVDGKRSVPPPAARHRTPGTSMVPVSSPPSRELPPLDVEDVDAIVMGLVDQLAGPAGMFPVEHLPALFVWREATSAFMRSVTQR